MQDLNYQKDLSKVNIIKLAAKYEPRSYDRILTSRKKIISEKFEYNDKNVDYKS